MSVIDARQLACLPDPNPPAACSLRPAWRAVWRSQCNRLRPRTKKEDHQWKSSISPNRELVTLINVFVVEPGNQEKLIEILKEGTEKLFSRQPGYISASFHKSKDGRRVINYGQWRSPKDIEAYRSKPEIGEYFKRVRELAQFESMVCDVSYVHRA